MAFDDLEPATDDSVSAVDQASHQSLVGVPARPWAGLLSPFPFLFLSRTLPVVPLGAEAGGRGQQSGPDTKHFRAMVPAPPSPLSQFGREGGTFFCPGVMGSLSPWVSEPDRKVYLLSHQPGLGPLFCDWLSLRSS